MKYFCRNNQECYDYFMNYFARKVQMPGQKNGVAMVLKSKDEGCGKGFIDRLIFKKENLLQMEYLIHLFSKKTENKYMYILTKRGHSKHTIKKIRLGK